MKIRNKEPEPKECDWQRTKIHPKAVALGGPGSTILRIENRKSERPMLAGNAISIYLLSSQTRNYVKSRLSLSRIFAFFLILDLSWGCAGCGRKTFARKGFLSRLGESPPFFPDFSLGVYRRRSDDNQPTKVKKCRIKDCGCSLFNIEPLWLYGAI